MEIFPCKAILTVLLVLVVAQVQATDVDAAAQLVDGPCFTRSFGGYLHNSTLPDGSLRLTAKVSSSASGRQWGLELMMQPAELHQIWEQAIKDEMMPGEMNALLRHCGPNNTALKSALEKESFNRSQQRQPAIDKEIQRTMPGFPSFPLQPVKTITPDEQNALDALRSDPAAMDAVPKLQSKVFVRLHELFLPISQQRARHIPYLESDHQSEAMRKFLSRAQGMVRKD